MEEQAESQAGPQRTSSERPHDKRASRACLQCRQRKQRCAGQIPCTRCADASRTCSFEQDPELNLYVSSQGEEWNMPPSSDPLILALQAGLARVVARVHTLESLLGAEPPPTSARQSTSNDIPAPPLSTPSFSGDEQPSSRVTRDIDMNHVMVEHSALRTMGLMSQQSPPSVVPPYVPTAGPSHLQLPAPDYRGRSDPVKLGILTMQEGQQLLDIFWEHCHTHAPLLCERTQRHAYALASLSPFLFTACLTVGARYWNLTDKNRPLMHPRYDHMINTMDKNISDLMLKPEPSDLPLGAIQGLLLCIQWSPMEPGKAPTSRFGDNAVWLMVGLAGRLARLLDLERLATSPFSGDLASITDEDMARMRTWLNLTSNDHFIWLVTNFPVSLDATAGVACARTFASHSKARSRDLFAASLA